MSIFRKSPISINVDNTTWLVIGGEDEYENELESTEYFDQINSEFTAGPDLPRALKGGCVASAGDGKLFVYGGSFGAILENGEWRDVGNGGEDYGKDAKCGYTAKRGGDRRVWVFTPKGTVTYDLDNGAFRYDTIIISKSHNNYYVSIRFSSFMSGSLLGYEWSDWENAAIVQLHSSFMVAGLVGKDTFQYFDVDEKALTDTTLPSTFGRIKHVQFFDFLPEYCNSELTYAPVRSFL